MPNSTLVIITSVLLECCVLGPNPIPSKSSRGRDFPAPMISYYTEKNIVAGNFFSGWGAEQSGKCLVFSMVIGNCGKVGEFEGKRSDEGGGINEMRGLLMGGSEVGGFGV